MSCCPRIVFRCFKSLERIADRITGAAGPFFVASAWLLIIMGIIEFFEIIAPTLSYSLLAIPICILLIVNLCAHYYYVITTPPGFVDEPHPHRNGKGWTWAKMNPGLQWSDTISPSKYNKCKRCGIPRPERAHHCRICKRCVLKYDHHCPWINQCVGLHNERHFVLFMFYLILCSFSFVVLGLSSFWKATRFFEPWPYWTPVSAFMLLFILSAVIGLALVIMCGWHVWSVAKGETSVESHDFESYRRISKERGDTFVNAFDLGYRKNLELFFNVGKGRYPLYTLLLPLRVPPYTDGKGWAKREGMERHHGIRENEEYTDEE